MDTLKDSSYIFSYHRTMAILHGKKSSHALGWRNDYDQLVRFQAFSAIADLNGQSVLDAGCGYGDLFEFLTDKYPMLNAYCGADFIPEMTETAATRLSGDNRATFISGNFLNANMPTADYVLASGSLNYASSDPAYIYKAIARLFACCTIGLGFNLLQGVKNDFLLVAYDPDDIINYCATLSENVVLKSDYDKEDFTVFVYR